MLTSFGSGEIWKGSNQEISVVLIPRCYKVEGEINDVVLNFYTTAGGTSIEFSGDTVTVSGINATVVFQPVQLDTLDDGLIRYNVAFNEGGESHVFDLETRYMLKTPNDYEPVDYVTHAEVEGVVDELLVEKLEDYYTSGETSEAISNAIAAETARTEQTYLKEHQSLDNYYTKAETDSAITEAISDIDLSNYYTSAQTDTKIAEAVSAITVSGITRQELNDAIAAETARTEQAYLKEGSLDDYYTKEQTNTAIQNAVSAITASGVTRQELDDAIAAETARTESTYLKEHQSLADYYTSAQTNSAIETAMAAETARTEQTYLKEHQSLANYYTSAQTDTAISNAIAAETARTEQTYLKEHQSLADYYTSAQTNSAITTAVQDKVGSATITQIWTGTQAQYNAMSAHTNNILYFING